MFLSGNPNVAPATSNPISINRDELAAIVKNMGDGYFGDKNYWKRVAVCFEKNNNMIESGASSSLLPALAIGNYFFDSFGGAPVGTADQSAGQSFLNMKFIIPSASTNASWMFTSNFAVQSGKRYLVKWSVDSFFQEGGSGTDSWSLQYNVNLKKSSDYQVIQTDKQSGYELGQYYMIFDASTSENIYLEFAVTEMLHPSGSVTFTNIDVVEIETAAISVFPGGSVTSNSQGNTITGNIIDGFNFASTVPQSESWVYSSPFTVEAGKTYMISSKDLVASIQPGAGYGYRVIVKNTTTPWIEKHSIMCNEWMNVTQSAEIRNFVFTPSESGSYYFEISFLNDNLANANVSFPGFEVKSVSTVSQGGSSWIVSDLYNNLNVKRQSVVLGFDRGFSSAPLKMSSNVMKGTWSIKDVTITDKDGGTITLVKSQIPNPDSYDFVVQ